MTSSASARVSGGRIVGSRRASIVLPAPGGPEQQVVSRRRPRWSAPRAGGRVRRRGPAAPRRRRGSTPRWAAAGGRRRAGPRPPSARVTGAGDASRRRAWPQGRWRRDHEAPAGRPRACPPRRRAPRGTAGAHRRARARRTPPSVAARRAAPAPRRPARAGDRQVEARPPLAQRRGGEVDRDPPRGNSKPELRIAARTRSRASRTA